MRAYYPLQIGEPTRPTVATRLYEARNLLAHNLGVDDMSWRTRQQLGKRRRIISLVKPKDGLTEEDVVEHEVYTGPPFADLTVRSQGLNTRIYVPGLYWALGRMLRAALHDQPVRCEQTASTPPRVSSPTRSDLDHRSVPLRKCM